MDISVIIPIYNTSKYLKECIESVLSIRNADRVEIILINDGSTDNSLEICQEYAIQNKNVIVIDKENEGAAEARNHGIKIAKGEYILFLDSDDFYLKLNLNMSPLDLLLETAKENSTDVLCFNYTINKGLKPEREAKEKYISDIDYLVDNNIFTSSPCIKLIKRSVLTENNIYFIKGTLSEDILFNAKLLEIHNVKIAFLNEVIYFYRQRKGSATKSISKKHILDLISIISELSTTKNRTVLSYAGFQFATLMININLSKDKIDKKLKTQIKKNSYLLKYNNSKTIKLIYITSKIIGIQLTSSMLSIYFKMKNRSVE